MTNHINNKFTAIYHDSWQHGGQYMMLTKMIRIEQQEGDTVMDMLRREHIDDCIVYLFHGHPLMQGEKKETTEGQSRLTAGLGGIFNGE